MVSLPPPNASYEELEDELIAQQTMLDSLDDDDHGIRDEIERTIRDLEERLRSVEHNAPGDERDGLSAGGEDTDTETSGRPVDAGNESRPTYSYDNTNNPNPSAAHPSSTTTTLPRLPDLFPNTMNMSCGHPYLPNGNNAHTFGQPSLRYKRPFEPSSPDGNEARVKRLTPTPSRSHTPSQGQSTSQSQTASAHDRRALLLMQQRLREEAFQRKREAEKADAALAVSLSQNGETSSNAGPSRSPFTSLAQDTQTSPSQWQPIFRPSGYRVKREQPSTPTPSAETSAVCPGFSSSRAPSHPSTYRSDFPSVHSNSLHSNTLTLPPVQHRVKTEANGDAQRPAMPHAHPRASAPLQVVDLTGSDDDDSNNQVIDLTRNINRTPAPYPQGMTSHQIHAIQEHNRQRSIWEAETRKRQYMLQQQMNARGASGYEPVYPGSSRSAPYSLTQSAMAGLSAASHSVRDFVGDLSQLSELVRGRGLGVEDDMYLNPRGYTPRDMDYGMVDPETTREDLRKLMENIQPEEEEVAAEEDFPIPGMTVKLKPYQMTGLKWLQKMETGSNRGGILADDMGLGKTVQAISLLVTHRSEDPFNKTTLILAPVALLRQWREEIASKIKPGTHALRVFLHHASVKKRTHRELRDFDVVLTTFGTIAAEQKRMDKFLLRKQHDPQATPRDDEKCLFIGSDCKWFRIIIDEAQCIKNKSTRTAKATYQLHAKSRFCLTGTPMMNGVEELYSLVHFLKIKPYSEWQKFNMDFVRPLKSTNENHRGMAMQKLQALLKAVLLRRNKQTKVNGRPILTLPERVIEETHAVFSDDEKAFYMALEGKQQIEFNKYLKAGTIGRSYAHILLLLLRLRQACCHPHLIKDFGVAAAADISQETMDELCESLSEAVVERLRAADGNFECPVCFDAVENPAIFVPCGHKTCTECFTRIADPANGVANGDENGVSAKCPECRAPINTKSVIDYECFRRHHMGAPQLEPAATDEVDAADAETDSEDEADSDDSDSEREDDSEDEDGTLGGFIVKDEVDSQAPTDDESRENSDFPAPAQTSSRQKQSKKTARFFGGKAKASSSKTPKKSKKAKGKQKMKKSNYTLPELKKLAGQSKKHKKLYMQKVGKDYIPSAKIEKTMEIIQGVMDNPEDQEKIIIFSQWTSLLDLLEIDIDRHHFGYRRYDGSMNAKLRGDAVEDFKNKSHVRMMLVSLKAGNAGLNLNVASQVIILDPFWNPYIEEQAIDRAHRLGQTRPVKVHRILVEETVEDRILALQEKKRAVISEALDEKASQGVSRLSPQELAYLFGINRNMNDPLVVRGR
ncbi:hypothetical protein AAFC00_003116 [Neodothiora populina]|uniref:Uncharacterized protein n=1 Tax=Neodothiora populina TaxID=2781224 RepID=A0ABR3P9F7_9PEZI